MSLTCITCETGTLLPYYFDRCLKKQEKNTDYDYHKIWTKVSAKQEKTMKKYLIKWINKDICIEIISYVSSPSFPNIIKPIQIKSKIPNNINPSYKFENIDKIGKIVNIFQGKCFKNDTNMSKLVLLCQNGQIRLIPSNSKSKHISIQWYCSGFLAPKFLLHKHATYKLSRLKFMQFSHTQITYLCPLKHGLILRNSCGEYAMILIAENKVEISYVIGKKCQGKVSTVRKISGETNMERWWRKKHAPRKQCNNDYAIDSDKFFCSKHA